MSVESEQEQGERKHTYYPIDFPIGEGKTDYEKYIRTVDLLKLQKKSEEFTSKQELLFQITHQASELWMKQMLYDINRAIACMKEDNIGMAIRSLRLVTEIQQLLISHIDIIARNLSIQEYEKIRLGLGQGSGMESPGFNFLLEKGPQLWEAFKPLVERKGVTFLEIYREYEKNIELHNLAEYMVDFDDFFHKWRTHHIDMVRRTIGLESNSLKGISSKVLQRGIVERFFPELFDVRNIMTNESSVAYGGQPLGS